MAEGPRGLADIRADASLWSRLPRRDIEVLFGTIDRLTEEVARLHRALGEQTEQVRRWRNRAQSLRRRRSRMMRRLGLHVSEDDSSAGVNGRKGV